MSFLKDIVNRKIQELGIKESSEFFEVSEQLVRQWQAGSKPISLAAVEKVFVENPVPAKIEEAEWEGKKVAILLPWYKSTNPLTAFSIMGILDRAKMGVMMHFGDAFIVHTRNKLATQFLKTGMEWSLWIDDDMILPFGNAGWFNRATGFNFPEQFAGLHTLNRLLSHQKTLVGALYFGRHPDGKPLFSEGTVRGSPEKLLAREAPVDVVKPTRWVATGCLLAHRKVYEDIQAVLPELAPLNKDDSWHFFSASQDDLVKSCQEALTILGDATVSESSRIAEVTQRLNNSFQAAKTFSRRGQGEDVTFSVRAARAGHQPYVDMGLVCGHYGNVCYGPRNTDG